MRGRNLDRVRSKFEMRERINIDKEIKKKEDKHSEEEIKNEEK